MPYCFPRSSIKFQGHTGQNITDLTQIGRFRTIGRSQLSNPSDLPCFLFINDISNFAVEACVLNMYADDVIIYTSATSKDELECRLQVCIDDISNWYSLNKLCIN